MQLQCPCCAAIFPLEAGFVEADSKKLAALMAEIEPALGKVILFYLRLFTPSKRGLKVSKAIKVVQELIVLTKQGTVSADARTSETKPVTIIMWVTGIEQVLDQRDKLTLPLTNHNYLRKVVYSIASDPNQTALLKTKPIITAPINNEANIYFERLSIINNDFKLKLITEDQKKQLIAALNAEFPEHVEKLKEDRLSEQRTATDRAIKSKGGIKNIKTILNGGKYGK